MRSEKPTCYRIVIKGALDPDWSAWLNGFEILTCVRPDGTCVTHLSGAIADQAALRGLLNRIWDLNLELLALDQVSETSDAGRSDGPARSGR